jgi:hypothetical protein
MRQCVRHPHRPGRWRDHDPGRVRLVGARRPDDIQRRGRRRRAWCCYAERHSRIDVESDLIDDTGGPTMLSQTVCGIADTACVFTIPNVYARP